MITEETYRRLYRMSDAAAPLPFDCGQICGAVCCRPEKGKETGIWLLPGEAALHEDGASMIRVKTGEDARMEELGFRFAECTAPGPEQCVRALRPIQCRSFPLWPYIDEDGALELRWNDIELGYACPLIESEAELDPTFRETIRALWERLAGEPAIRAYLRELSREAEAEETL
ncbi:hypothetical protein [Lachnoclostridium sp. Marseille-P6806]|uniref:hypothetical protein n=1 Tax=Lachnoclostridium sp. Marseille-P6806 TaxID=2364793 RepID=UPI00102F8EC0|nr:hypothetical protein [Lachnoclostridium sp. Marseille-P6806]